MEKIKLNNPQELISGDKIGPYLNFMYYEITEGYKFYETCGLNYVYLHWQTINWLLSVTEVQRKI